MKYATLYETRGIQFLGRWHDGRQDMLDARRDELAIERRTRAIATLRCREARP